MLTDGRTICDHEFYLKKDKDGPLMHTMNVVLYLGSFFKVPTLYFRKFCSIFKIETLQVDMLVTVRYTNIKCKFYFRNLILSKANLIRRQI